MTRAPIAGILAGLLVVGWGAGTGAAPASTQPATPDVSKLSADDLRLLVRNLYVKLAEVEGEASRLRAEVRSLKARTDAMATMGPATTAPASTAKPAEAAKVTAAQLRIMGEKWDGRRITLEGVRFIEGHAGGDGLAFIEADRPKAVRSGGGRQLGAFEAVGGVSQDEAKRRTAEAERAQRERLRARPWEAMTKHDQWVRLTLTDNEGNLFSNVYASKEQMGERVAGLKRDAPLVLTGTVIKMESESVLDPYGLIYESVTVAPAR